MKRKRIFQLLTLSDGTDERTAATDVVDVVVGDDDDGDDDGIDVPVRCLKRANALLIPSVLLCDICTFTINFVLLRFFPCVCDQFFCEMFRMKNIAAKHYKVLQCEMKNRKKIENLFLLLCVLYCVL